MIGALPYHGGLRIGEVVGLDIDDISLSAREGTLRVVDKARDGGKIRQGRSMPACGPCCRKWLDARRVARSRG